MSLTVTLPEGPPRSTLPPGGLPADDAAYLAWRNGFLQRAFELETAIRWHETSYSPLHIEPWRLDWFLFESLGTDPLFPVRWSANHRLRFLAVALKTNPGTVLSLATRFINKVVADETRCAR